MKYGLSNIVYPACLALALAAALASPLGTATIGVDPTPEHLAAGDGYSTLVTGLSTRRAAKTAGPRGRRFAASPRHGG